MDRRTEQVDYIPDYAMGLVVGKGKSGLKEIANKSGADVRLERRKVLVSGTSEQRENAHLMIRSKICHAKSSIRFSKANFSFGGEDAQLTLKCNDSLNRYVISLQEPPTSRMTISSFEGLEEWIDENVRKAKSDMDLSSKGLIEIYQGSLTVIQQNDGPLKDQTISFRELKQRKENREYSFDFNEGNKQYHPSSADMYTAGTKDEFQDFQLTIFTPSFNKVYWRVFYKEEANDEIRILRAEDVDFGEYYCEAGIGYVYLDCEISFVCDVLVPGDDDCIRIKFQIDRTETKDSALQYEIGILQEKFFQHIELYREGIHKASSDDLPKGYTINMLRKKWRTIYTLGTRKEIDAVSLNLVVSTSALQGEKERKVTLQDIELNERVTGNNWDLDAVKNGIRELFDFALYESKLVRKVEERPVLDACNDAQCKKL